jgi:hypothetical protein
MPPRPAGGADAGPTAAFSHEKFRSCLNRQPLLIFSGRFWICGVFALSPTEMARKIPAANVARKTVRADASDPVFHPDRSEG